MRSAIKSAMSREQVVVVHAGARDNYQVARALEEAGRLHALVTDLFCPESALALAPPRFRASLARRSAPGIPAAKVRQLAARGLAQLAAEHGGLVPFAWKRGLMRRTDRALGRAAGLAARRAGASVLAYSYYGADALAASGSPGMLFQLHPHPASVRRILRAELGKYPECAESLAQEWELCLPEPDFRRLCAEPGLAARVLAASSFTRRTLIDNGIRPEAVTVIPYGVDARRFSPGPGGGGRRGPRGPLRPLEVLFVGRINQRKGIRYLLDALRLLAPGTARLTVCGRVVDSLGLFRDAGMPVTVRPSVSEAELVDAYRGADLFVLPSVAEGFGQVLLEALGCGTPVLATNATAAPDLIRNGVEGWVVEPGRADLLAERIGWAAAHRAELAGMRAAARARAEACTWAGFRAGVAAAVERFLLEQAAAPPACAEFYAGPCAGPCAGPAALPISEARHV